MKTKTTNSLPAKVENIENQNSAAAPAETPEQEQQEQEQEKNEVHHTITKHLNPRITPEPITPEQWPNMDSKGWNELPKNAKYNFTHRFSSKDFSNGAVLWSGTIETESTTYDFKNCTITQIKELFGLAKASNGGGSYTKSSKGCKSEEDITNLVDSFVYRLAAAVTGVNKILAEAGDFAIGVAPDVYADCIRAKGQRELAAHRAKLAEDEKKQARKNLKDASDEDKNLAAAVVGMTDIQKELIQANLAGDLAKMAEILARMEAERFEKEQNQNDAQSENSETAA